MFIYGSVLNDGKALDNNNHDRCATFTFKALLLWRLSSSGNFTLLHGFARQQDFSMLTSRRYQCHTADIAPPKYIIGPFYPDPLLAMVITVSVVLPFSGALLQLRRSL